jgi:hypothetical protein
MGDVNRKPITSTYYTDRSGIMCYDHRLPRLTRIFSLITIFSVNLCRDCKYKLLPPQSLSQLSKSRKRAFLRKYICSPGRQGTTGIYLQDIIDLKGAGGRHGNSPVGYVARYPYPSGYFGDHVGNKIAGDVQEFREAVGPDLHMDHQVAVAKGKGHMRFRIIDKIKRAVLFQQLNGFVIIDPFMKSVYIGENGDQFRVCTVEGTFHFYGLKGRVRNIRSKYFDSIAAFFQFPVVLCKRQGRIKKEEENYIKTYTGHTNNLKKRRKNRTQCTLRNAEMLRNLHALLFPACG